MGFGSASVTGVRGYQTRWSKPSTGFRSNSNRSGTTPAHDWANYAEAARALIERFRGVVIENRDAIEVLIQHDQSDALHYVDPPYVASTRDNGTDYKFEMTNAQHVDLANVLSGLKGKVALSGYHSELYDDLYRAWHRVEKKSFADGARKRTEVLWLNYKPEERLF